jgi:hypothetical protein
MELDEFIRKTLDEAIQKYSEKSVQAGITAKPAETATAVRRESETKTTQQTRQTKLAVVRDSRFKYRAGGKR